MNSDTVIETERTRLRKYSDSDADNLLKIFSDPVAMENFTDMMDREGAKAWIEWNKQSYDDNGFGLYSMEIKETGEFIGYCGFILQRNIDGRDEIEISYALVRNFWNMGYGIEAASACRDYGFEHLSGRLISLIRPENKASRRLAEKNGMKEEKTVHCFGHDHLVYLVEKQT